MEWYQRPVCADCTTADQFPDRIALVGQDKSFDGMEQFFDRDGRYHYHDPNPTVTTYECSYGHRWDVEQPWTCQGCVPLPTFVVDVAEMRCVGFSTDERFCVLDERARVIGVSVVVHGDPRRWMLRLEVPPPGSMSLAWPE